MRKLFNVPTSEYEHPFDRDTLSVMKAIPLLEQVSNAAMNWTAIKWKAVELAGSNFHVTNASCPELYSLVKDCAQTLDLLQMPEIYTEWGYFINAYTTGYKDSTLLVLYTGTVDMMEENELRYVVGHELGHIKSGHVLYHMIIQSFANIVSHMKIAEKLSLPLYAAMMHWYRMSEFTADRAGLLACQDLDATLSSICKSSGLPIKYFKLTDTKYLLEQAMDFQTKFGGTIDSIIRGISILDDSHPWAVLRAAELVKWVDSGAYDELLNKYGGIECPNCHLSIEKDLDKCPYCGCDEL